MGDVGMSFFDGPKRIIHSMRVWWRDSHVGNTAHSEVVESVKADGSLNSRYGFMVAMSCAIAILGLLLSSPAVVIGAMLISPLMAPIISFGFSLCLLDFTQMRRSLEGILAGVVLALAVSWLIVTLSPLTDVTAEIIARTRPNLFDLLVAIFSGMAGGYAVINRKGETIVGVAIATALMPPLAVVGFGLATGSTSIAGGAFMLFMTNLLAISLSVTLMARFYGFGPKHSPQQTVMQIVLIACVFGALSVPLGVALKDIALQTYVTKMARNTIQSYFGKDDSYISMFKIDFERSNETKIRTIVLTANYHSDAQSELKGKLAAEIGRDILLSLNQVVVAHDTIREAERKPVPASVDTTALRAAASSKTVTEQITEALRQATFFPTEYIKVDAASKTAQIYCKQVKGIPLSVLRQFEASTASRYPGWHIRVVPPIQSLPNVYFDTGSDAPNETGSNELETIIWALHRWEASSVRVAGFASTVGEFRRFDNTSLAYRRTQAVTRILENAGITARSSVEYRTFRQREMERDFGTNSYQRVEVRLDAQDSILSSPASPTTLKAPIPGQRPEAGKIRALNQPLEGLSDAGEEAPVTPKENPAGNQKVVKP